MRNVLLVVFCLPIICLSQDKYSEVVTVDSTAGDVLFSRARVYITEVFKFGKEVTQLTDENANTIMATGVFKVNVAMFMGSFTDYVRFRVSIQCKDNRYKYAFTDVVLEYQPGSAIQKAEYPLEGAKPKMFPKKLWEEVKLQSDETIRKLMKELKSTMSKKDDW